MRRAIAIFLVSVLFLSGACAEMPDFSGMTQAEIMDVINAGRNALYLETQENCLFKYSTEDGLTIIINGIENATDYNECAFINVTIINDSDADYYLLKDEYYINGWKCESVSYFDVNAHRKSKEKWVIALSDADLINIDGIEDIEIYLSISSIGKQTINLPKFIIPFK